MRHLPRSEKCPGAFSPVSPRRLLYAVLAVAACPLAAQDTEPVLPKVTVSAPAIVAGSAKSGYRADTVQLGALGTLSLRDTPFSVGSVSSELIRNIQASTVNEALKYQPNLYTNTGAGQITHYFTLRGITASTWTYNTAVDGMRSFDIWQPLEDKERIEVLAGPNSFLYGITSPAGMINYVLKRPDSQRRAELTLGTYDEQFHTQLNLGGALFGRPELTYRLDLGYANEGDTGVDDQGQHRRVFSGALAWQVGAASSVTLDIASGRRELDHAQALFMTTNKLGIPSPPDTSRNWGASYSGATDATDRFTLGLETALNEVFTLRTKLRYSDIEREYFLNRQVWQNAALDYRWRVDSERPHDITVKQFNVFLDAAFATGPLRHRLTLGTTWDDYDSGWTGYRGTTYDTVYPGNLHGSPAWPAYQSPPAGTSSAQQTTYGTLMLADRIAFGERLELMLGATRARVDDTGLSRSAAGVTKTTKYDETKTTPVLSLSFRPIPELTAYASYVESLQQGFTAGSATLNAGQTFAPFVAKQHEIGAKATLGGVDLNLAWFRIKQANQYIVHNVATQDGRSLYQGWELTASGQPIDGLTLTGGFTWLDARIDKAADDEGNTPQGAPEKMAKLYAEYELPFVPGLIVTGGFSYTGKVPWDPANTLYVDSVTVADAGLRYHRRIAGKDTTWRLNVANLADKDYWATRSGILYPGAPRTVSFSASVAF